MSEFGNTRVIITKPLQYLIARQAVEQLNIIKPTLAVIPHFDLNGNLIKSINNDKIWGSIEYHESKISAIIGTEEKNLLTNSDIGKDAYLNKIGRYDKIVVYEEGWGTYLADVLITESRKKRLIYSALNFNKRYGNSKFTDYLLTYHSSHKCTNKNILFKEPLVNYLQKTDLSDIFGRFPQYQNIDTIVLLGKDLALNFELKKDLQKKENIIYKNHPHMTMKNIQEVDAKQKFVGNDFIVEFFLIDRISKNKQIKIIHDNSSLQMYFRNFKNIIFENKGKKIEEIHTIIN